ncbi:cysteine hydrolase family protein [Sedimenticola sp.]|uniref:cysteine hydrolase family protein n=1 Tax=Sedimenticola sp. TaxID=1940285 RepID=UPI003D0ACE6C
MSQPQTLLTMAGATRPTLEPDCSALLLIDMQREYVTGRLPLPDAAPALERARYLLDRAREVGMAVVHVAHRGRPGGAFDPAADGFLFAPEVTPVPGERIIEKGLPNAFADTELDSYLKQRDIRQLLVIGFMTHMCVSSTVRAALDLGYISHLASDACATRDLPAATGDGVISARQLQASSLAGLADRFAWVDKSREWL